MLFVGIDIAKRNHEASVIAQDGRVVRKAMRFANFQAGYNKFMDMVRSLSEPVVFGMEATGHYWLTLYTHLRNDGYTVHVINPIQSDALRGMYIRKTKTDSIDSVIIADVIRFGKSAGLGGGVYNSLAVRAGVFLHVLFHHAPQHRAQRRADRRKNHRVARQRPRVFRLDAPLGEQEPSRKPCGEQCDEIEGEPIGKPERF